MEWKKKRFHLSIPRMAGPLSILRTDVACKQQMVAVGSVAACLALFEILLFHRVIVPEVTGAVREMLTSIGDKSGVRKAMPRTPIIRLFSRAIGILQISSEPLCGSLVDVGSTG